MGSPCGIKSSWDDVITYINFFFK